MHPEHVSLRYICGNRVEGEPRLRVALCVWHARLQYQGNRKLCKCTFLFAIVIFFFCFWIVWICGVLSVVVKNLTWRVGLETLTCNPSYVGVVAEAGRL